MRQEFSEVMRLLIKIVCCTKKELILSRKKVEGNLLYWYVMKMLKDEGNFVGRLFSFLPGGLESSSSAESWLELQLPWILMSWCTSNTSTLRLHCVSMVLLIQIFAVRRGHSNFVGLIENQGKAKRLSWEVGEISRESGGEWKTPLLVVLIWALLDVKERISCELCLQCVVEGSVKVYVDLCVILRYSKQVL